MQGNVSTTVVVQCTVLVANTISYTGKFAKMVHPDFFGENGGRSPHHSDLEN